MTRAVVFAYHDVGVRCLSVLLAHGVDVALVVTHDDDPRENVWFGSVERLARDHDLEVAKPARGDDPALARRVAGLAPEFIFSFYYRHMLPAALLALARRGAFNMHGSLLPKYRGRVPVNWAVLRGEKETGVTLHHMVKRADAGDIVDQEAVPIGPDDTAFDVFNEITAAARKVLERQLDALRSGTAPRRKQDESMATIFGGRKPEDGRIDWTQSAEAVYNLIRAVTHPYPGAFTDAGGKRLIIWRARPLTEGGGAPGRVISTAPLRVAAATGAIEIIRYQRQGSPEEDAAAGTHGLKIGEVLGSF